MISSHRPVVAIVQARMTSTRLPGKTLMRLDSTTILEWVLRRLQLAEAVDQIAVATSRDPSDDPIERSAAAMGTTVVRGSLVDVLDRYRLAAEHTGANTIVRITADCPFLDPAIVDAAVGTLVNKNADYASTNLDAAITHGLDVEAFTAGALEAAAAEANERAEREHVTPFLYRRRERFVCVTAPVPDWGRRSDLRLTVDEPADLELLQAVVERLGVGPEELVTRDVIELLAHDPALAALNASVHHRHVVQLRSATRQDADLLLGLRNDPLTVRYSRSGRAVTEDEHRKWIEERIAGDSPNVWIAIAEGEPVGQTRIDVDGETGEVGIVVAPSARGRGFAATILEALTAKARQQRGLRRLVAQVHTENTASLRAFQSAGFDEVRAEGPWHYLELTL